MRAHSDARRKLASNLGESRIYINHCCGLSLKRGGGIPPLRGHLATHDARPFGCASKPRVKPRREPDIHQPQEADGGSPQLSTQGCTRPSAASRENATSQQRACAQHAGFSVRSWHSLKQGRNASLASCLQGTIDIGQHPCELERLGWVGRTTLTPAVPTLGRHRS